MPYLELSQGSDEGANLSSLYATVDPSLIAAQTFDNSAGTNGLVGRGVMASLTADNWWGDVSRGVWNNTFGLTTGAQAPSLGKLLSTDEATQQYGMEGLKFDQPIHEATARYLNMLHKQDAQNQAIMSADPHTWSSWGESQLAGVAAGFTDPATAALNLLPPMRLAGLAERIGLTAGSGILFPEAAQFLGKSFLERAGMRALQGSTTGVIYGAATGGMEWALSSQEQRDYKMSNMLQAMLYGGITYGLLHTAMGAGGDLVEGILKPQNFKALGLNIDKSNFPVDALQPHDIAEIHANGGNVSRAISLNDQVIAAEMEAGRPLSDAEKIQVLKERNGARLPDDVVQAVADEKAERAESFRAQDESQYAALKAQLDQHFDSVATEEKAIADAQTPEEQIAAVESSANARETEVRQWEAARPQRTAQLARSLTDHWKGIKVTLHDTQAALQEAVFGNRHTSALEKMPDDYARLAYVREHGLDAERFGVPDEHSLADTARREAEAEALGGRETLLSAVKDLGGIPTEDATLSGELKTLRENAGKGGTLKLFRKSAKSLDALREALGERGFHYETPADMVQAISDSLASGKDVHGFGEEHPFSMESKEGQRIIKGVYDPATGVHIVLEHVKTPQDLADVLRHEGVHVGFSRLFTDKDAATWRKMAGDIYDSLREAGKSAELDKIAADYGFDPKKDPSGLIEEYMARQANAGKDMGVFSEMLTKLKLFLTKVIPSAVKWSAGDIEKLVGLSEQKLVEGGEAPNGEAKYSMESKTPSDKETPQSPLEQKLIELNDAVDKATTRDEKFSALQAKRATLIDHLVKDRVDSYVARFKDPYQGMMAFLGGTNAPIWGARDSVDARIESLKSEYEGVLFNRLNDANLFREFKAKECQIDIARELWKIGKPDEIKSALPGGSDPRFEKIAQIIADVRKTAVARSNRAGSFIADLPGYLFRQSHDMVAVQEAGFDAWRDYISPRLDWNLIERQHGIGADGQMSLEPFDREAFLQGAYDGIKTGVHLQEAGTLRPNGSPMPASEAIKVSASRKLHFASADGFLEYNDKFGTRNLADAVLSGLKSLAHSTALMEKLGTRPEVMFQNALSELRKSERFNKPQSFFEGLVRYKGINSPEVKLQNLFAAVAGLDKIPGNVSLARLGAGVRAISGMARMGQVVLGSIPDIGLGQRELAYQGIPALHALDNVLLRSVDNIAGKEGRRLAACLGAGTSQFMEDIMKRLDVPNARGTILNGAQNWFYKLTGIEHWDAMNKRGVARAMSSWLGLHSEEAFEHLDPATQRVLRLYSIGEKQWDAVRGFSETAADGNRYVLPEHVQNISDDALKELKTSEGVTGSLASFRDELQTRWMNYFTDRTGYAIPRAGARERAILLQGTRPGTGWGEASRFFAQFKSFGVTHLTRVVGRELYGRTGMTERFGGMTALVAMTTALGYAAVQLRQLASGKTPLPANMQTFAKSLVAGGGFGIATDFIFGQNDPNNSLIGNFVAGPVGGDAAKLINMAFAARDQATTEALGGKSKGGLLNAANVRSIRSMIPFNNLIGLKLAIDYGVMYRLQEWLNPGYLNRMERNLKNNSGQEFYLPPSQFSR